MSDSPGNQPTFTVWQGDTGGAFTLPANFAACAAPMTVGTSSVFETCGACGQFHMRGAACPTGTAWPLAAWAFGHPAPRLSDEDVERIAKRVVELLRADGEP